MAATEDDLETSRRFAMTQRPRDAATLIMLRHDGQEPRILLGRRHSAHAFMPDMFVFPGGRLDAADCRTKPSRDLHPDVLLKLMVRMRGRTSRARARGLAVAAVRETFEETGLLVGTASGAEAGQERESWQRLVALGIRPNLSGLRYFARAITPPGRTRRFDSRFFVLDASEIANLDRPWHGGSGELLAPEWFTFGEALKLDLPFITRDVISRLEPLAASRHGVLPDAPVCFQYQKGRAWREEAL
jgi:8-oxo-dGTP pyrophosphatase MutT (NUDIX family)